MPKTIILDDETYNKLKKKANEEDRSISKMAKILFGRAMATAPVASPVPQQPNLNDMMLAAYAQANGTMFDESMRFATADEAIDFYAKSSKPIHTAGSSKALGVKELIDMSDEMKDLKAEVEKLDDEFKALGEDEILTMWTAGGGDVRALNEKCVAAREKVTAIYEKADNFMRKYQGLTN